LAVFDRCQAQRPGVWVEAAGRAGAVLAVHLPLGAPQPGGIQADRIAHAGDLDAGTPPQRPHRLPRAA
jgi:hypothetical protein